MVRRIIIISLLTAFSLFSCSSDDNTSSEESFSESYSVPQTEVEQLTTCSPTEEESSISEYPTLDYEYHEKTEYTFHKEVVSASEYFNITEFTTPQREGLITGITYLVDDYTANIYFAEDNVKRKDVESGLYNIKTGEYEAILLDEQAEYTIVHFDENYIIYSDLASDFSYESLWYYDKKNKHLEKFYDYPLYDNGRIYSYHLNQMLIVDDTLYFDDFYKNDSGEVAVKLYSYNFKTGELKVEKDNAQNPMLYNDEIICITLNSESGEYDTISSLEGDFKRELSGNIYGSSSLKTNKKSIYSVFVDTFFDINNYGYSDFALLDFMKMDMIISTNDPLCDLSVSDNFVCWSDYAGLVDSSPCMYDVNLDKIILFDSIPIGEYHIFAYDDHGMIVHYLDRKFTYYYFEYK